MSFPSKKFSPWVSFQYSNETWAGTEGGQLIQPIFGAPFPSNYPFKMTQIENNGPIFDSTDPFFRPTNLTVTSKVAIQKGYFYDLSSIERFREKPLVVSKKRDGRYKIISSSIELLLNEEEMEVYRVPIYINGSKMETIDFSSQASVDQASLDIRVKFDANGNTFPREFPYDPSMILMLFTLSHQPRPDQYTKIQKVELFSYDQLRARGGRDSLIGDPYLKNRAVAVFFTGYSNGNYISLGSPQRSLNSKNVSNLSTGNKPPLENPSNKPPSKPGNNRPLPEPGNKSPLFKERELSGASYKNFFSLFAGAAVGTSMNLYDHLLLRI